MCKFQTSFYFRCKSALCIRSAVRKQAEGIQGTPVGEVSKAETALVILKNDPHKPFDVTNGNARLVGFTFYRSSKLRHD